MPRSETQSSEIERVEEHLRLLNLAWDGLVHEVRGYDFEAANSPSIIERLPLSEIERRVIDAVSALNGGVTVADLQRERKFIQDYGHAIARHGVESDEAAKIKLDFQDMPTRDALAKDVEQIQRVALLYECDYLFNG